MVWWLLRLSFDVCQGYGFMFARGYGLMFAKVLV